MIAHNPLHGSGQAALPHPALALGDDAHATQGMAGDRQRQPASDEASHAIPKDAAVLAAPRQRTVPEPPHLESKNPQRVLIHGHPVVPAVSTHHRLQPFALVGDGFVHASLKFGFHLVQLRLQSLAYRLPQHRKPSIAPLLHADMRNAGRGFLLQSDRLPWLRFPKPPYDPGQPVFPGPVQTLAILRWSSRCQRDLSAGTHTSLPSRVYHRSRPLNEQRHSLAQWAAAVCPVDRQVPRAPLPDGIITSAGAMSCTASKGVTLSSLLLRAHAPARLPSAYFGLGLVWRIFAGYCQFLLRVGPSRRYLRATLLGCLDLCHGGIWSALARYFLHIVGLPPRVMGRLPTNLHPMTSWWALFSRLQPFLNVQTSKLACHPGHPYRNGIPVGQPWRLHPGI